MKVVEIFNSIEGEGKRVGKPCTFIRLFGCNLRCTYCDSMYAVEGVDYVEKSVQEILDVVKDYDCPLVTVTGGEPLIHKDIDQLLKQLSFSGYEVNVETNGSIIPTIRSANIFYTIDFKTNASGESSKMKEQVFITTHDTDVIKCVVGSREDMVQSLDFLQKLGKRNFSNVYLSPVYGMIEPIELVNFIKDNKLWTWSVQVQLHKIIWNPNMKGV